MNKTLLTFALGCVIVTATAGTAPAADTEKVARTPEELQAALDPCGDYTTSKIVYPWERELQKDTAVRAVLREQATGIGYGVEPLGGCLNWPW
ncbi:MAG: hypothetical protein DBX67_07835 [Desulfovibrionaceae bacterium]|nr:MAG: hypothetical protein DBX67_07835 [Desulfovibrionaceae bacterium]